ncbi:MAG: hypothetical protein K6F27_14760 [Ruminococcus sp.]|nr:hypothetical protein [Ruminococcus sp.]
MIRSKASISTTSYRRFAAPRDKRTAAEFLFVKRPHKVLPPSQPDEKLYNELAGEGQAYRRGGG